MRAKIYKLCVFISHFLFLSSSHSLLQSLTPDPLSTLHILLSIFNKPRVTNKMLKTVSFHSLLYTQYSECIQNLNGLSIKNCILLFTVVRTCDAHNVNIDYCPVWGSLRLILIMKNTSKCCIIYYCSHIHALHNQCTCIIHF